MKDAVFALKRHSSPGPDGFTGAFFTSFWEIIGSSVIAAIQNFFSSRKILKSLNTFFLALIPKSGAPKSFNDYRPISLLNFSFKIITQIMASRLAPLLPSLVSPNQAAFIRGRSIHDHIALAHELVQRLKLKLAGGSLCLKLDISKAFDKLKWSFLLKTLAKMGFSSEWIELVQQCVCTSRGSVLINREPCGFFSPECGAKGTLFPPIYSSLQKKF